MKKIFKLSFASAPVFFVFFVAFAVSANATGSSAAPLPTSGSISVCNMIADSAGKIYATSAGVPTGDFSVALSYRATATSSPSAVNLVSFSASSFNPNTLVMAGNSKNGECVNFSNLPFGYYYYSQEKVEGSGWSNPKYNDGNSGQISSLNNLFDYAPKTNTDSDGVIVLGASRPSRTLVVLNSFKAAPTPYPSQFSPSAQAAKVAGNSGTPQVMIPNQPKISTDSLNVLNAGQIFSDNGQSNILSSLDSNKKSSFPATAVLVKDNSSGNSGGKNKNTGGDIAFAKSYGAGREFGSNQNKSALASVFETAADANFLFYLIVFVSSAAIASFLMIYFLQEGKELEDNTAIENWFDK